MNSAGPAQTRMGTESKALRPRDLEQVVRASRLLSLPILPKKSTRAKAVSHSGRSYKVRAYRSEAAARKQLELLQEAGHLFPRYHGRVDRCLVFDYVGGSAGQGGDINPLAEMGRFLAELSTLSRSEAPEAEFGTWCSDIEAARLFLPETMSSIRSYFRTRKESAAWGLEYFDARLDNFVFDENGSFISVDEKHLRVGPRGIGLVRPMWLLREEEFSVVLEAYRARVNWTPFLDAEYSEFITFYFLISLLAFHAVNSPADVLTSSRANRLRRRQVLSILNGGSRPPLREEVPWLIRGYLDDAWRFTGRACSFVRRKLA